MLPLSEQIHNLKTIIQQQNLSSENKQILQKKNPKTKKRISKTKSIVPNKVNVFMILHVFFALIVKV